EELRVGGRQPWQQAPLVLPVVQENRLLAVGAVELTALGRVGRGDVEAERGRPGRRPVQRHPALDERSQHREEPAARAVDRARVCAVRGHVTVAVEQIGARDTDVVEAQPSVVDAVEAALEAVVLAADPGKVLTVLAAERDVEAVHSVVHALGDELREDGGGGGVQRRVAQVLLRRRAERRVDHELLGLGVIGRGGADRRDVRAMADLGHREGAGDREVHDPGEPAVVV
ncbi:hypothetical protein ABE10_03270, partial [Bacillus toyonensis]|nr:hypothetical protein [Bacillus toyonensis]